MRFTEIKYSYTCIEFNMRNIFVDLFATFARTNFVGSLFLPTTHHDLLRFFNPYLTNGFSHHYHLDESTFIFRGVRSDF